MTDSLPPSDPEKREFLIPINKRVRSKFAEQFLESFLKDLADYFRCLDTEFEDIEVFCAQWSNVGKFSKPEDLTECIYNIAIHIGQNNNNIFTAETLRFCINYMRVRLSDWERSVLANIDEFKNTELHVLMDSLQLLQTRPSPDFVQAWLQTTMRRFKNSKTEDMINYLLVLSRQGIDPGREYIEKWLDSFANRKLRLEQKNLTLRALAIQDVMNSSYQLKNFASQIFETIKNFDFQSDTTKNSLYSSCLWFGFPYKPADLNKNHRTSASEKTFIRMFSKGGIPLIIPPEKISETGHIPDIQLQWEPGHNIYGELDGNRHFVVDSQTGKIYYNGSTLLQRNIHSKIAKARGDRYFCFPDSFIYEDLNLMSWEQRSSLLWHFYAQASAEEPGVYYLSPNYKNFRGNEMLEDQILLTPFPYTQISRTGQHRPECAPA